MPAIFLKTAGATTATAAPNEALSSESRSRFAMRSATIASRISRARLRSASVIAPFLSRLTFFALTLTSYSGAVADHSACAASSSAFHRAPKIDMIFWFFSRTPRASFPASASIAALTSARCSLL